MSPSCSPARARTRFSPGYEWYDETPMMRKYKKLPQFLRVAAARDGATRLPYFKGHDFIIKASGRPEDYFIGQALVWPDKEALRDPRRRTIPTASRFGARGDGAESTRSVKGKRDELDEEAVPRPACFGSPGDILLKADKMCMAQLAGAARARSSTRVVMEHGGEDPARSTRLQRKNTKYILRQAANTHAARRVGGPQEDGLPGADSTCGCARRSTAQIVTALLRRARYAAGVLRHGTRSCSRARRACARARRTTDAASGRSSPSLSGTSAFSSTLFSRSQLI